MTKLTNDAYYKIASNRRDYKGERYFRFNQLSDKVIQVCVYSGDEKKGKSNTPGIYLIDRMTFLSNYLSYGMLFHAAKRNIKKRLIKS
ncbi:MAG TPA: hypothetical protein VFJ43_06820 [Bacteroidia bacterium]|nr:hypothetical protein [Bacteroidia bacterium]